MGFQLKAAEMTAEAIMLAAALEEEMSAAEQRDLPAHERARLTEVNMRG